MKTFGLSRRLWLPRNLVRMMPVVILITTTVCPSRVAAASPEAIEHGVAMREMFGLPADRGDVADLIDSDRDVGSGEWGFPMTEQEEAELDIPGRERFVHATQDELLPYAEKLDGYAGAWVDQAHGGRLVIGLTKVTTTIRAVLATTAPWRSSSTCRHPTCRTSS